MISRPLSLPSARLVLMAALATLVSSLVGLFSSQQVVAESRYVTPSAEIALRTGPGTEHKIIGLVKDGEVVELLAEEETYAQVRAENGKEGWMVKRYLSTRPPLSTAVASLRKENEQLKQRDSELSAKLEELTAALNGAEGRLGEVQAERDQLKADYTALQQDTADVLQLKQNMERLTRENESLAEQFAVVKEQNSKLDNRASINWFLAGGGVLLIGMVVGRLTGKSRKRKSSLL